MSRTANTNLSRLFFCKCQHCPSQQLSFLVFSQSFKLTVAGGRRLPEPWDVSDWSWVGEGQWVFMAWFQTPNTDSLCHYNIEFNHIAVVALKFIGAMNWISATQSCDSQDGGHGRWTCPGCVMRAHNCWPYKEVRHVPCLSNELRSETAHRSTRNPLQAANAGLAFMAWHSPLVKCPLLSYTPSNEFHFGVREATWAVVSMRLAGPLLRFRVSVVDNKLSMKD